MESQRTRRLWTELSLVYRSRICVENKGIRDLLRTEDVFLLDVVREHKGLSVDESRETRRHSVVVQRVPWRKRNNHGVLSACHNECGDSLSEFETDIHTWKIHLE